MKIAVQRPQGSPSPLAPPGVAEADLRAWVRAVAEPRHRRAQPRANRRARDLVADTLSGLGYRVAIEGALDNVVARPKVARPGPVTLVGAHYDSVPATPGADDNASAVAVMLAAARALAARDPAAPVWFVGFNAEEDGFLGAHELVAGGLPELAVAHVLEMVGYTDHRPGSQRLPAGIRAPGVDRGDFLALLSRRRSNRCAREVARRAAQRAPDLPVVRLETYGLLDRLMPDLHRSDHVPFWKAGLPAVMWTDTAEFRNPNYHRPSDTPDTLDYRFMAQVAQALTAAIED